MQNKTKTMIVLEVIDVRTRASKKVIHNRHFVASCEEPSCQMGTNETSAARYEYFFEHGIISKVGQTFLSAIFPQTGMSAPP
jgi:hypothetical protein